MSEQINLKDIIKQEYILSASDPVHFIKKYCYIQHPIRGRILFNLFPFQEKLLRLLLKEDKHFIINKSRQLGISTLAAAYSLWLMLFHKDKNILCIATKQETAKNMVTKVKFMFDNLPSWLKIPTTEHNKLTLRLSNGSQIKATSAASDAGRSEAVSLLLMDEAAFIDGIDLIWAASQQTMGCIHENSIIYTDKGLYRIKELFNNPEEGFNKFNINIFDKNNEIQQSSHFYKSPKSQTLKISFKDGNYIITTKKHPLLNNENKWVNADKLNIGDKIKCYYNQNTFGDMIQYPFNENNHFNNKEWKLNNIDLAYLIGLFIAEGSYSNSGIQIANGDEYIQKFLLKIGFKHYSNRVNYILNRKNINKLFKDFLKIEHNAINKYVPSPILRASKKEQIAFLQGCFDGDGCSHQQGISYASISEKLVHDIHIMLLNFGIKSYIIPQIWKKNKVVNKESVGFKLNINKENSLKFYDIIGFRLERKNDNINKINKIKDWGGIDINIDKKIIKDLIIKSNISLSKWNRENTNIEGFLWRNNKHLSKQAIEDILNKCDKSLDEYKLLNNKYKELQYSYYNEISNIEIFDNIETYDLKVPINESFLANNIVNHNTGGRAIVISSPNGVGNWFHKTFTKAEIGENNNFIPIKLPWFVHPERDQKWRDKQDIELGDPKIAAQECFSGDTIIYTKNGPKYIKDIKVGDIVLSHDGTYNKVINTFSQIKKDNLFKIKNGINNIEKYVTGNHPFYNDNEIWTTIKDIIPNKTKIQTFPNVKNWENNNKIDLTNYIEAENPKYFPLKYDDNYIWLNKKSYINRYIEFDYELGFILGCFLSEGCYWKNVVSFSYNNETEQLTWPLLLEKYINKKFNITIFKHYISKRDKGANLYIKNQIFKKFIELCIIGGKYCYEKHLSPFIYNNGNKKLYKGIIDGIMVGDGLIKSEYDCQLGLTSKLLIYDFIYINNLLGINNIILKQHFGKNNVPILGGTYNTRDSLSLRFPNTKINSDEKIFSKRVEEININQHTSHKNKFIFENNKPLTTLKLQPFKGICEVFNFEVENTHTYVTEYGIVHNCDADFQVVANAVFYNEWIEYLLQSTVQEPIERRGLDKSLWIWEQVDYNRDYALLADVARGDGKDYSAFHVIDIETNTQVAEWKGQIPTREFGLFLVGIATEYNNALLVIDNASVGWDTVQTVLERGYSNLYYSPKSDNLTAEDYMIKYDNNTGLTPGFSINLRTRPLIINKFREYVGDKSVNIRSKRLIEEMKVFVWKNGRAEAQYGYNDDLVMSFSMGMYLRDTTLKYQQKSLDLTRSSINNISKINYASSFFKTSNMNPNPYNIQTPYGDEDTSWLL